jgi:hypothetical protein
MIAVLVPSKRPATASDRTASDCRRPLAAADRYHFHRTIMPCCNTTLILSVGESMQGLVDHADMVSLYRTPYRISAEHNASGAAPPLTATACPDHEKIVAHAYRQSEEHDICLIDCAGFSNQTSVCACGSSDLVLIPVTPDRDSVIEAKRTAGQIENVAQGSSCGIYRQPWSINRRASRRRKSRQGRGGRAEPRPSSR